MTGFAARRFYNLNFDEYPDLEGLRIKTRSTTVGVMRGVIDTSKDDRQGLDEMLQHLVDCVVEWNLEDEHGRPVEVSVAAVMAKVDLEYLKAIVRAWQSATIGVQPPLARRSPSGGQSPVVSIPMESLSESQAS